MSKLSSFIPAANTFYNLSPDRSDMVTGPDQTTMLGFILFSFWSAVSLQAHNHAGHSSALFSGQQPD